MSYGKFTKHFKSCPARLFTDSETKLSQAVDSLVRYMNDERSKMVKRRDLLFKVPGSETLRQSYEELISFVDGESGSLRMKYELNQNRTKVCDLNVINSWRTRFQTSKKELDESSNRLMAAYCERLDGNCSGASPAICTSETRGFIFRKKKCTVRRSL